MIATRTARTALTALAVSVSSLGMPAYAASNVGSASHLDSMPAAPGDGFTAPDDPGTHTDVTIGFGTQTGGVGFMVGHRTAGGLRVEGGLGTLIAIFGLSAAAGFSGTIYESARSRVEIPVLATFALLSCTSCGTDSGSTDTSLFGAMTGIDWSYGRSAASSGLVLSLRAGIASSTFTDHYEDGATWTSAAPLAQLGVGWTF